MSNDEVLEYLVKEVEETGVGTTISLYINGLIVTGQLIRSKRYYDLMSSIHDERITMTNDLNETTASDLNIWDHKQFLKKKSKEGINNIEYTPG